MLKTTFTLLTLFVAALTLYAGRTPVKGQAIPGIIDVRGWSALHLGISSKLQTPEMPPQDTIIIDQHRLTQ